MWRVGRFWSTGFVSLQLSTAINAALVFASNVLLAYGDIVVQVPGLPIGAIISASCVNALLDWDEHKFLTSVHICASLCAGI